MQFVIKPSFYKYVTWVGIVACAYFIFGLLGLFLAVAPSNAGAVWPPAGISLASVLLLGKRIWPGIFIGNFCISAWAFGFYNAPLIVYVATGFGATLNALVGSKLIHQFVGFPNKLIEDRAIFSFLLLGGPISCLLPATIGLATMTLMGIVSFDEIPVNWFSWWVGDTIGVLVFTPLALIFFGKPRAFWRQRRMSVGAPLTVSFLLVIFFFVYASKLEQEKLQQDFKNLSTSLSQALINRVHSHIHLVYSLRSFFIGSHAIEKNEFTLFADRPLSQFKELEALSWLEKKSDNSHPKYTVLISKVNTKHYDEQRVLSNLENFTFNKLKEKKDTTVSIGFGPQNLYFYLPVFQQNSNESVNSYKSSGLIVSFISIKNLLSESFKGLDTRDILLTIRAPDLSNDYSVLFTNIDPQIPLTTYPPFAFKHGFSVDNEKWQLEILPNTTFISSHYHWTIWSVLIGGLLFSSLLGTGLLLITGRYFRTEAIVTERTEALLKEIKIRKQAERNQKLATIKAESASNAKNLFLSNMSHELRTPLNGILGFTQLLQKDQSISKSNKDNIDIIGHCGDYLLTLINDILDISLIESKKIEIELETFDFLSLVHDIIEIFKLTAYDKNIIFSIDYPKSLPQYVLSDEKRLRQIIVNLLSNAFKFTERGEVVLTFSYHNEALALTVSDTGCGISATNLRKIFKPFVQISKPPGSDQGTGLGLAITSQLIDLMGGNISVESKPGHGSIFSISVPLSESTLQLKPLPEKKKIIGYQGDPRSVLIVDDNPENLSFLKQFLQNLGFNVSVVKGGSECLEFCSEISPDLVLMDMLMPEMNGMETTRKLLYENPSLSYRIIGMSASVFTEEKRQFMKAGCAGFISKPIRQDELLACVEATLKLQWLYDSPNGKTPFQSNNILIADDNEINCLLLKNMLENYGFQIDMVNNGKTALELLIRQPYQAALIDLNMPIMSGTELITTVRYHKGPNQQVKMAAISAYAEQDKVTAALESGFDDYLIKPIDEVHLREFLYAKTPTKQKMIHQESIEKG